MSMGNVFEVVRAIERVRSNQSHGKLRKESGTALGSLMAWLAASGMVLIDQIPHEWSVAALILGALVGVANVYVARFTEPAVTASQQQRIVREMEKIQEWEAANSHVELPVYDGASTADALGGPVDYEGRHRAVPHAD